MKKIFSFLLLSAFLGFVGCGSGSKTPEDAAIRIAKYTIDGDIDKVIKEVRDRDGKPFGDKEMIALMNQKLASISEQWKQNGEVKAIKTQNLEYKEDTKASVEVVVEFSNGAVETERYSNIWLIDGEWRVVFMF